MSSPTDPKHIVVIGAGITGLTAAYRLLKNASAADYLGPPITVTIVESSATVGGKIRTSPFGGISAIDEGPDAYLARVPQAVALARELQLGDDITHPTAGHAAVMHKKLHPIPEGLTVTVDSNTNIKVEGINKQVVGQFAAEVRRYYPPEPFKGKGVRYVGELVRRKAGKSVK